MSNWLKALLIGVALVGSPVVLAGCQRSGAEKVGADVGEKIDEATDNVKDAVEEAGDKIEDATDKK